MTSERSAHDVARQELAELIRRRGELEQFIDSVGGARVLKAESQTGTFLPGVNLERGGSPTRIAAWGKALDVFKLTLQSGAAVYIAALDVLIADYARVLTEPENA